MNQRTPKCLLLDLGLVMVDLDYGRFGARMKALTGLNRAQLQAIFAADDLGRRFETGSLTGEQFFAEVCRRTGREMMWAEFLDAWNSIIGAAVIPDQTIAVLAGNVRLWAISNTNELHFGFLSRNFSFLSYFEGVILSHEVGVLKPDSRIFHIALSRMQADPAGVLFVDDQEANITAARELGIDSFQFLDPDQFAAELARRGLLTKTCTAKTSKTAKIEL
jgi:glucose-1-phosphatase